MREEIIIVSQEYDFEIGFYKEYGEVIARLEGLEKDLALDWLRFGASYLGSHNWRDGTSYIFVPGGSKRSRKRHRNKNRFKQSVHLSSLNELSFPD